MMDWTDRHARVFHRGLTRRALLYTEMVTTAAVIHGKRERLLSFSPVEHPVALQLGGSEPDDLARSAAIGAEFGYDEINLNCGCPSDRVQSGRFGACLMAEPLTVARGVAAMIAAVGRKLPVTVKCRIGIDDQDAEEDFRRFIESVAAAGCTTFIVHARKAWLKGLSPRENREIPPLDYDRVYRLKQAMPLLTIVINGGIASIEAARRHLDAVDGVMLGRAAYQNPWSLAEVDARVFGGSAPLAARADAIRALVAEEVHELARLALEHAAEKRALRKSVVLSLATVHRIERRSMRTRNRRQRIMAAVVMQPRERPRADGATRTTARRATRLAKLHEQRRQ